MGLWDVCRTMRKRYSWWRDIEPIVIDNAMAVYDEEGQRIETNAMYWVTQASCAPSEITEYVFILIKIIISLITKV